MVEMIQGVCTEMLHMVEMLQMLHMVLWRTVPSILLPPGFTPSMQAILLLCPRYQSRAEVQRGCVAIYIAYRAFNWCKHNRDIVF